MTPPLLVAGIGNTTIRLAMASPTADWPVRWQQQFAVPLDQFESQRLTMSLPAADLNWFVASVNRPVEAQLRDWVAASRPGDTVSLLSCQDIPLRVAVPESDRVGMDRLVAAASADRLRRPDKPAVIIDAGTAVTVDWLDAAGTFQGGAIMPGVRAMSRALADNTDLLPVIDVDFSALPPALVGTSTAAAIRSGLFHGILGAIHELVARYEQQNSGPPPQVFLTGGDAPWLTRSLRFEHTLVDDLGLQGIVAVAQGIGRESGSSG